MELRMFKYRIYPSQKQKVRFLKSFSHCKFVYNELLGLNKKLFVTNQFDFNSLVRDIKICNPEIGDEVHSQVLQNVSDRLSKAFNNFFRRIKLGEKPGFPRFKSRINSITYPQGGFKFRSDKRLFCSKIGNIPIVLHRVPRGKVKTLTVKRNCAGQWFVVFCCEVPKRNVTHIGSSVGIDVGLETFATMSDGVTVENPRFLRKYERRLARIQRVHSRKKVGGRNREKSRVRLARYHLKVKNIRCDWLHKTSFALTQKYGCIVVEDLSIKNMMRNHCLAKSIGDASWGVFIGMLSYKAVTGGGQLIKVPARGTTTDCHNCGNPEVMPLSKREFRCSGCGLVCHRDLNASINIYDRAGLARISTPVDIEPLPSPFLGG